MDKKFDYCWTVNALGPGGKLDQYIVWAPNFVKAVEQAFHDCTDGYKVVYVDLCDSNREIFVHNNFGY